jgi:hypothetical protein
MLIALAPRLQISYLLDADPAQARARKPEYPLDFLYANRQSYLDLNVFFESMTLIAPMPIEDAKREVWEQAIEKLAFDPVQERDTEPAKLAGPYSRPAAP